MIMFLSDFGAEQLGRHVLRGEAIVFPTDWEIALHTADPTRTASTADEVDTADWSNYVRQTLARDATDWVAGVLGAVGYRIPNNVIVDYGTVTLINPTTISHITIRDGSDNGWFVGTLSSPVVLVNGQPFTLPVGALGITWQSAT